MAVPSIVTQRLELVLLTPDVLDALVAGRREEAGALAGIRVPDGWPDERVARFLRLRADQTRKDQAWGQWLVRAIALREPGRPLIGHAGFHGPPGINGPGAADAVEVGYTVLPEFRGNGYATEAARALLEWARAEHGILRFIASVAPDNVPSLALVRRLGFVQTGRQWDDEDGEELVFELRV